MNLKSVYDDIHTKVVSIIADEFLDKNHYKVLSLIAFYFEMMAKIQIDVLTILELQVIEDKKNES